MRSNSSYVWRKCKIFKNKWVKVDTSSVKENLQSEKKIELELAKIAPPWVCSDPSWIPECQNNEFFDHFFDFVEFNSALDSTNVNSAPGPDGISYKILKSLPVKYKLILLDIFNEMFQDNDYPPIWKQAHVHFIDKANKKGVRPISLTSCVCKLFEKLIKNRFQWWIEYHKLLPISQCGFRKGRSCTDNLVNLTLQVDEALSNNEEIFAAFLDVDSAFPSVNCDILITKLSKIGCSKNVINFIKFLTHERYITTDLIGDQLRMVGKGLGQGGVLSPLLYVVYVSEILKNLPEKAHVTQFADDIEIHSKSKTVLENAIVIIKNNLLEIGLDLSPQKTVFIHFNKKNILPGESAIIIDDHNIKSSERAKFLGIYFDFNHSFMSKINEVQKRCHKALNIIKFVCGTWWGSHPETLIILYKSFVRSIIDYGSYIYFPKLKSLSEKLEKIQFTAIRAALGYRNTTPTNILIAESKLIYIKERTKFLCKRYLSKALSNTTSPTYEILLKHHNLIKTKTSKRQRIINECLEYIMTDFQKIEKHPKFNIYMYDYKIINTSIPVDFKFGKTAKDLIHPNSLIKSLITNNNVCSIFTDGSKITGNITTGLSVICPELEHKISKSIDKEASIYTAECIALHEAMLIATRNKGHNFLIFSDSQSALQNLVSTEIKTSTNKYIYEIKKNYLEFLQNNNNNTVKFIWIPAHVGIEGNEEADLLAKNATKNPFVNYRKIPYSDFFEKFKMTAYEETKNTIKKLSLSKGKNYFKNFYADKKVPWFSKKCLRRDFIVTINRIRANHYNLAASLARVNIINDPKCQCQNASQDINHVLWQCELYATQREKFIIGLRKCKVQFPLCIDIFVQKPDIRVCKYIFKFLKDSQLNI